MTKSARTRLRAAVGALALAVIGQGGVAAQDTFSGSVTAESRAFVQPALFSGQHGTHAALVAEPELFWSSGDGKHAFTISPFVRLDSGDPERTHVDIRELFWQTYGERWELEAGFLRTFWGVTESQHLVDVINQTDLVENPDGEDKLGQPAVHGTWLADWGTVDVYLMPLFRERTFAGADGRLRFPLIVQTDAAEVERTLGVAVRWFHFLGPLDLGVASFYGTAREPRFRLIGVPTAPTGLAPVYERVHQLSVDAQLTHEGWLWKLEAITRSGQGERFYAATAGLEYTLSNISNSGVDLGLLGEYSYDTRSAAASPLDPVGVSLFDDDLFVGGRLALNDVQSSEVLGGAIVDLELGTVAWLIEARRRVGASFTADFEIRAFSNTDLDDPLYAFRRDSYAQLGLSFYY